MITFFSALTDATSPGLIGVGLLVLVALLGYFVLVVATILRHKR